MGRTHSRAAAESRGDGGESVSATNRLDDVATANWIVLQSKLVCFTFFSAFWCSFCVRQYRIYFLCSFCFSIKRATTSCRHTWVQQDWTVWISIDVNFHVSPDCMFVFCFQTSRRRSNSTYWQNCLRQASKHFGFCSWSTDSKLLINAITHLSACRVWCAHFAFCDEQHTGVLRLKNQARSGTRKVKPILVLAASHEFKLTPSRWKWKAFNWAKRGEIKKNIIFRWFILFIRWDHLSRAFTLFLHQPRGDLQVWSGFISFSTLLITVCFAFAYTLRLSLSSSIYIHIIQYIFFVNRCRF